MDKRKILLIDYDPSSVNRFLHPLTQAGYEVEVATDGLEGLAAFERVQPDLVLVEAMLPRKHGFEVCQEIKQSVHGKRTPVVITTAVCRGRKYRTDALTTYGCDEYVEKPIPGDELVSLCHRFIAEWQEREQKQKEEDVRPAETGTKPTALDGMSDEEIEARLDSLLIENDAEPAAATPPPAAPDEKTPSPIEQRPVASPASSLPDLATMGEEELMRRLDALVDSARQTAPEPQSAPGRQDAPAEPKKALAPPSVEPVAEKAGETEKKKASAVPETKPRPKPRVEKARPVPSPPEPRRGKSRLVWGGAIAAGSTVALVAALAFTQGWFDGKPAPEAEPPQARATLAERPTFPPQKLRAKLDSLGSVGEAEVPTVADLGVQEPAEQPLAPAEPARDAAAATGPAPRTEAPRRASGDDSAAAVAPPPTPPPARVAKKPAPPPKPFVEPDPQATAALRTNILSSATEDTPAPEAASSVGELPTDTPLGSPVKPLLRGDLVELADVDSPPIALHKPPPAYHPLAARLRQEGTVELNVLVDDEGKVVDVELLGGIPKSRLNDAAIEGVRRWKYQPATKDGVPVKVWKRERIVFKL